MTLVAKIWRLLDGSQRRWVLIAQLASLVMASCTVAGIAAISPFFALLADPQLISKNSLLARLHGHFAGHSERDFVVALGIGFAGMVVIANVLNGIGFYAMQRVALRIGDDLRGMLFGDYLHRGILYHAGAHGATLCSNVAYETERAIVTTLESSFVFVTNLVTTVLLVASVLFIDAPAAVAILSALLGGYSVIYLSLRARIYRAGQVGSTLAATRTKLIIDSFGAIKEISIGHKQAFFQRRFNESSAGLSRAVAHLDALTNTPRYLMESIAACGLVSLALTLSGPGALGNWLGQLSFLAFAVYRLLPALHQIFASVVRIRAAGASFAVIDADLAHAHDRTLVRARARAGSTGMPAAPEFSSDPPPGIEVSHVTFRYAPAAIPVLDDVSLSIDPGSIVGLIGTNGSGKTTLVDIIAGLLVPGLGHVSVDGVPLDATSRPLWQPRIAYVPQNPFLLDASIEENIALGIEPKNIDQVRLRTAARLARLDDVLSALSGGYRAVIGERGIRLSGGQRQRLGIARALYTDASILIMDESTNALDQRVEGEIMAVIEGLRGTRTVILIAHRWSILRRCDKIYELHRGRISDTSLWRELAAKPPLLSPDEI